MYYNILAEIKIIRRESINLDYLNVIESKTYRQYEIFINNVCKVLNDISSGIKNRSKKSNNN